MWLLTNINTGSVSVLLVINEKSKYTVGRVGADLLITGDTSVSRTHAFIHIRVDGSEANVANEMLELEDAGSKFGTFHNDGIEKNVGVPKNTRVPLSDGDRIRFGLLQSSWSVSRCPPVSAMSTLPAEQAQQLAQHLKVLGGKIQSSWDDSCTHLTMAEVSLTLKVLHALLDQKPIVTCDYWRDLVQIARRGLKTLPKIEEYLPACSKDIAQNQQLDLRARAERKTLFIGLTFVFLSALHNKTYAPIVEKAGGRCKHLNVGIQRSFLVRKDVVVIQYIPSSESQSSHTISSIESHLSSNSRRIVPEYEIGLAIIHCSTEKYCNPDYDLLVDLMPTSVAVDASADDGLVLAPESSPNTGITIDDDQTEVFIPETNPKSVASTNISEKSSNVLTPSASERIGLRDAELHANNEAPISDEICGNGANKFKRGRATKSAVNESDSEEELFNFPKKANANKVPTPSPIPEDPPHNDEINTSNEPPISTEICGNKVNKRKRTGATIGESESDEELFNFPTKANSNKSPSSSPTPKRVARDNIKSPFREPSPLIDEPTTSKNSKVTPRCSIKPLPNVAIGRVVRTTGFLEKPRVTAAERDATIGNNVPSKETTKRARLADICNSDDDDLFCFGDESPPKNVNNAKRLCTENINLDDDSDKELFAFGDTEKTSAQQTVEECGNATQPFRPKATVKYNDPPMPKPKLIPAKLNTANWLSFPHVKMEIKEEQVKEDDQQMEKNKNNEELSSDSEKNSAIIGGALVKPLSKIALRQATTSTVTTATVLSTGGKRFQKKFNPQQRQVIRTLPITVSGF